MATDLSHQWEAIELSYSPLRQEEGYQNLNHVKKFISRRQNSKKSCPNLVAKLIEPNKNCYKKKYIFLFFKPVDIASSVWKTPTDPEE
jgi:hypothetical protein